MSDAVVWSGRFLRVVDRDGWTFAQRPNISGIVGIVAVTDDRRLVLVEQHRQPVGGRVLELPAGLAGDGEGHADEPLLEAAKRELLEETGYEAAMWRELFTAVVSPGLTDEAVTFFHATGLTQISDGGGDDREQITVHLAPLENLLPWLLERQQRGVTFDAKVLAGVAAMRA